MPIPNNRNGFVTTSNICCMASRLYFMASDIRDRPMKMRPRPDKMNPVFCRLSLLQAMLIIMPMNTKICM